MDARRIVVEVEGDCARLWGCVGPLASAKQQNGPPGRRLGFATLSDHLTIESHATESCVRLALLSAVLVTWVAEAGLHEQLQRSHGFRLSVDLHWPNFTRVQPEVARFYELNGYQLAWVRQAARLLKHGR